MIVRLAAAGLMVMLAAPALAQGHGRAAIDAATAQRTQNNQNADQDVTYEEQVVVTASKSEEQLVNAPAAVSVITTETIQNSPATNIGDLLRAVPGVNVSQVSARDVNITTRGATSTLSTSQLALVDGRSVYLDFFGMVDVGSRPDQSERDQADRSHSRPGVGRLGRQRHERRRQRDHEDRRASWPAAAKGTSLTIGAAPSTAT